MPFFQILLLIIVLLVVAAWIGLRVKPRAFPPYPKPTPPLRFVDLPSDLPPPVRRFFEITIGEQVPVIESAVITGVAYIRFMGIRFPGRLRFTHRAGFDYRHYMETTLFGYPLMKVNEWFVDGKSRLELPFGVVENEPKVDSGAHLGLWGESMWLPSIFVTDPRVRWEAINETNARMIVPFGDEEDSFTFTFDPESGLMSRMEAMRWQDARDPEKTLWTLEPRDWQAFHGMKIPATGAATWASEGTPWLVTTVTDVAYNVDVSGYIRARGL